MYWIAIHVRGFSGSFAVFLLPHCLVSNCDRDLSSHLKTYSLRKCKGDIGDEVDLLLSRAGEFNIIVLIF